jgi:hypothetical protein
MRRIFVGRGGGAKKVLEEPKIFLYTKSKIYSVFPQINLKSPNKFPPSAGEL